MTIGPRQKNGCEDEAPLQSLPLSVFESSINATARVDRDGTVLAVSGRFKEVFGCIGEDVEGTRKLSDFALSPPLTLSDGAPAQTAGPDIRHCHFIDKSGAARELLAEIVPIDGTGQSLVSFLDLTEHAATRQALDEAEARFRLVFHNTPFPALLLDGNRFVDCNEAALAIIGYSSKEEVLGLDPARISPKRQPDGALSSRKSWQYIEAARTNGRARFEWLFRNCRGEMFWADVSLTLIPVAGKEYLYATWRDISARKQTEEALSDRELQLQAVLDASPVPILWADIKGSIEYVNPKFVQVFGYDLADIPTIADWFHLAYSNAPRAIPLYTASSIVKKQGEAHPSSGDVAITCKDGSIRYVTVAAAAVSNRIIIMFNDLTVRKRAEEAIIEREERYGRLVGLFPIGIFIAVDGRVVFANPAFTSMVAASRPDEVYGMRVIDFVHPDYREALEEKGRRLEKDGGQARPFEERFRRIDGAFIDVKVLAFPFDYQGMPASMIVAEDVTYRKQTEEALRKRERELESKSVNLAEANTALKVLLKHRDDDKKALENRIASNVKELVLPYIEKLKRAHLTADQRTYLGIVESGLKDIVSPFLDRMTEAYAHFTPTEIQVANLIKNGKTSKEIGEALNVSRGTVDTHRNSIRKKLGLRNKAVNLRSHLLTLQRPV